MKKKLKLNKKTIRQLTDDEATQPHGGHETRAFTGCIYCGRTGICPIEPVKSEGVTCATEPHVGCCNTARVC